MSGNQIYEFHKREIQDLRKAKECTLSVCRRMKVLTKEVLRDELVHAEWLITMILDNTDSDESCLDPVEHLLEAIAEPFEIPINFNSTYHSADSSRILRLRNAHRAAWKLRSEICDCVWNIWWLCHPNAGNDSIIAASDAIVESHWHEFGKRLKPLADFEFDALMQVVENESARALNRCRDLIVGVKGHAEKEPRLVISDGEQPQAIVDGEPVAITVKQVDLLRRLLAENGEYVSLTEHKFRSRDVEGLPERIKQFVETQPGAGTRIPHDKLFAVKDT